MNSDLYDHPALFDALLPVGAHLPYYEELARRASGHVLELACGTGQLTVPIASAGLPIVGLDLSAPMLNAATERAATANVSVEYVLGDSGTSIWAASLGSFHRTQLSSALAFDIFNPNVRLRARPSGQRFPVFQVETESFGKLSVEETTDYDPATQVGRGRWYISAPDKPDAWVLSLELRNIFPEKLPLLLAAGGFHLKSRAEDFVQAPFNSTSRWQVCLCQATV